MEELKTSEIMEKQIVDEARKKAQKILQGADQDYQVWEAELNKQRSQEIMALEEHYSHLYKKMADDLAATLPLDLKRRKLAFIAATIEEKLTDFLQKLKPAELITVLKDFLASVKEIFQGKPVDVLYAGLKAEEVKDLIASRIPGVKIVNITAENKMPPFTGFLMTSTDGKVKFRCTLDEIREMLLAGHREEMYKILFKDQL